MSDIAHTIDALIAGDLSGFALDLSSMPLQLDDGAFDLRARESSTLDLEHAGFDLRRTRHGDVFTDSGEDVYESESLTIRIRTAA